MTLHHALPHPRTPSSGLSHVRGFDDQPLSHACLHELLAQAVQRPGADCTEQELRTFCEQNIAHFKEPRYIRMVEELPVTVTGRPQKFLMREAMVAEWGLNHPASA